MALTLSLFKPAYADATEWTADYWTYASTGEKYPSSLQGVTVTFNTTPANPDPYMELSGGNIMWYPNRYYAIGAFVDGRGFADYWYSEVPPTNNPWYILWNDEQNTASPINFFDANNGWYSTSRTITFGSGFSVGGNDLASDCKILYLHDFIRYVVDNSDFRSRYTFPSVTPGPGPDDPVPGEFSIAHLSITQEKSGTWVHVRFNEPLPDSVTLQIDGIGGWSNVSAFEEEDNVVGGFKHEVPYTGKYRMMIVKSGYETAYVDLGEISVSGGDFAYIIGQVIDTLTSIFTFITPFTNALLGWLPAEIRVVFITVVITALVVGLISIIRG